MRTLGMIGGMSWVSTAIYYETINKAVAKKQGGLASAPLLLESHDFAPIAALQSEGEWDRLGEMLGRSAQRLEQAGAEGLIICSNTMHKICDAVRSAVSVPLLHIGDLTAERLLRDGAKRVALLGTRFTMMEPFYRERLEAHGIQVSTPEPAMMKEIDRIIFEELTRGHVSRVSQRALKSCITMMGQAKAQAVILGCTELVMLVDPGASVLPVYDTTALHSDAAAAWILGEREAVEAPAVEQPALAVEASADG